jgi:signal transduction histidine kinase/AmiR/NasT family two-component response regulator
LFRVLSCIRDNHDIRFVLVAAFVCLLATSTAVWLHARTPERRVAWRSGALALTGVSFGAGVWATHFIAMLAYEPHLRTGYDLYGTAWSLVTAMIFATAGFTISSSSPDRIIKAAGGALVGAGIGAMHFIGMWAFRPQGVVLWDRAYVLASLVIGVVFGALALLAMGRKPGLLRGALAALTLTLAICGMHFTAMAAVTILPDSAIVPPPQLASRPVLAVMVLAVAVLILLGAALVGWVEAVHRRGAVAKLRSATNAMPAALAMYDADDRLLVWNATYERLRPHYAELLKPGLLFDDMVRADGFDETWLALRKHERREGKPLEIEMDGGHWVRIENTPTADGGLITVGVDVTEMKRHAEALASALAHAEAASRAKSEFLANMSHEIRTPLNGVAGLTDVLARTRLSAKQRELVRLIRGSAETVDDLLGEILDLSGIEAGLASAAEHSFHLDHALSALIELYRPRAAERGLELRFEGAELIQGPVRGDEGRLKQLLGALLSNAIKFTDQGEVVLSAEVLDEDRYRLALTDTGVGFDMTIKEQLFERFTQADGSSTRRRGGSGLGLALARRCADLLGAELDCSSQPGRGSTFTLELRLPPAEADPSTAAGAPLADAQAEADRPVLALIVDDNATNRRVLEMILEQVGIGFVSVGDGLEAVEACEARRFDVILMDIQMPVMDGLAATREIRLRETAAGRPPAPVIVVSANCLPEQVAASRQAGAGHHLAKPISADVLLRALADVIGPADRSSELTRAA